MMAIRQASRALAQQMKRRVARAEPSSLQRITVRRVGGGHGSGAPHESQAKQAFLFNEGPSGRKVEIWEHITSITYWSTFFILIIGLGSSPETRIKVWAAEEAEARLARLDEGKSVGYGKVYHQVQSFGGYRRTSALDADSPPEEIEVESDD